MLKPARIFILLVITASLSGCGTLGGKIKAEGGLADAQAQGGLLGQNSSTPEHVERAEYSKSLDGDILGVKLKNKNFDIPVVFNREVEQWMRFFTERGREHFEIYLDRMGAMIPLVLPQLREAGMPEDLIYLSMIESGFSMRAKSHAGAVGPWQFIRSTGRIYDLRIDAWVDERSDPVHATQAAIRYLKNLYEEFGDWELAAAAYNSGEIRIRNAIQKLGTRDFFEIAQSRKALRKETRNYVPKMMAAAILAKNADLFGFRYPEADPKWLNTAEVHIPKPEDLRAIARVANIDAGLIKEINPELLHSCTPPSGGYTLRLPKESVSIVNAAIDKGDLGRFENFRKHTIKKGDSLSRIARKYGVPKDVILDLNELKGPQDLRLGQELILPGSKFEGAFEREPRILASHTRRHHRRRRTTASASISDSPGTVSYTVQKGDTLYDISRRYSVSIDQIKDWNEISHSKRLQPGSRLKLYVRNDSSRI